MAFVRVTLREAAEAVESDRSRIDATTEADIRRQMAEDGEDALFSGSPRVVHSPASLRAKLGLTQDEMAAALGMPQRTWQNWEANGGGLDPISRALLDLVADDPERAFRVLGAAAE